MTDRFSFSEPLSGKWSSISRAATYMVMRERTVGVVAGTGVHIGGAAVHCTVVPSPSSWPPLLR
jgi:hypothetical protein